MEEGAGRLYDPEVMKDYWETRIPMKSLIDIRRHFALECPSQYLK